MDAGLLPGLAAALAGAACYGSAPAIQAVAARRETPGRGLGVRLTLRLAGRPLWLLGLVAEIGGFALEAYAFSRAPATLVAPVMTCDLVIFVLLAAGLVGERPAARGLAGITVMAAGITLLALAFAGHAPLGRPAGNGELWTFLALCGASVVAAALVGNRALAAGRRAVAAGAFSLASGVSYGLATMTTRQIGRTFSADAPWHLLTTPTPYVLAACSLLAITMMQRGLQAGALLTYPVTSVVSSIVPVLLGAALLDEPVPGGGARAAFVVALVLVVAGAVLLAQDRARAPVSPRAGPGCSA